MKDYGRKKRWLWMVILAGLCLTGCGGRAQYTEEIRLEGSDQEVQEQDPSFSSTDGVDSGSEGNSADGADRVTGIDSSRVEENSKEPLFVYVCGAVHAPGVYELPAGARVYEAIAAAGGVTGDAAAEYVNQARMIEDGERVYIPTESEAEQGTGLFSEETQAGGSGTKVNINTAGLEELMTLTGIGESKASSIISYREVHGRFHSIEDLMQIEGIKEGVFNKIKDDITV